MAAGSAATGLTPIPPARLAREWARCHAQMDMAARARVRAAQQLEDATRRREAARRRAGERILPMWRARRACYDSAGPIVAMWSDDQPPGADGSAPAGGESLAYPWTELAEGIVNRLFAISLVITSTRSTLPGTRAGRLDEAVDMLDLLIRDVRRSVWRDMTSESRNLLDQPGAVPRSLDSAVTGGVEVPPAAGETRGTA